MKADFGRRRPAIKSSNEVFPAPEGPQIAVTCVAISTSTAKVNSESGSTISFSSSFTCEPLCVVKNIHWPKPPQTPAPPKPRATGTHVYPGPIGPTEKWPVKESKSGRECCPQP